MSGPGADPWWMVLAAAAPSACSGAWVIWRWWTERDDERDVQRAAREEAHRRELEQQRLALGREHADLFERVRTELQRCQSRLADVERDRDRGWDLARWWNRRAHELRYAGVEAQAAADGLALDLGVALAAWPDMTIPGLEDPR